MLCKYLFHYKDEIIQSLRNEASSLQKRVGKLESQVCLLEDAVINNEIKMVDEEYHPAKSRARGST